MINRRDFLQISAGVGATLGLTPRLLEAIQQGQLIQRAIPSSGERLPVIGLGSSATFSQVARGEDHTALKAVFQAMADKGAKVFDTAPSYGASEQVAGNVLAEMGLSQKMFWATKLNVARGGTADPAAAKAQVEQSFARFKQPKIDLIQVHNMADPPTQLGILKEYKAAGKIRYIGITTTNDGQYGILEEVMKKEPLDFIGVDYAVDNRGVEERILPLARERKIGVLVYVPFGRTSLFRRVAGQELPAWAKEFDATTWAQFFLKFILANPAVTAITPATSQAKNMLDNIGGGIGKLPTPDHVKRMIALVEALPGR